MSGWLLDTHVWIWNLMGDDRLPKGLRRILIEHPDECRLSAISVWEAALLFEKNRLKAPGGFDPWFQIATETFPIHHLPVTTEIVRETRRLTLPHRDPADAFIAATASIHDLVLLTVDRHLRGIRGVRTRSA